MARRNVTMGQDVDDDEETESTDKEHNKEVMHGWAEDSRFDEGSTDHDMKIVRPSTGNYATSKFHGYMKGK